MHDIWASRFRCFTPLIWFVSLRFFTIGFEYIFQLSDSSVYWKFFADVSPPAVGVWMVLVGALGIVSQIFCWQTKLVNAALTRAFAIGVIIHSLFRLSVLVQNKMYGDPLVVLFLCDFAAMLFILVSLPPNRKLVSCS